MLDGSIDGIIGLETMRAVNDGDGDGDGAATGGYGVDVAVGDAFTSCQVGGA